MITSVETGFQHAALFYRSGEQYAAGIDRFVRDSLTADAPVVIAVPPHSLQELQTRLEPDLVRQVKWTDMAEAGRNPGRIIHNVLLAAVARHQGRRVSIVGEPIWPGRTEIEYPACATHEALINEVFEGRDTTILCPYNASDLQPAALADARRTHPLLVKDQQTAENADYDEQAALRFNTPLPHPPPFASTMAFSWNGDLARLRSFVSQRAQAEGLATRRTEDLVIAVNELATNTVEHSRDAGALTVWAEPGMLVIQLRDNGRIADPLTGRIPPADLTERGHGLFLVNLICDLVRVHSDDRGTTIRLQIAL